MVALALQLDVVSVMIRAYLREEGCASALESGNNTFSRRMRKIIRKGLAPRFKDVVSEYVHRYTNALARTQDQNARSA